MPLQSSSFPSCSKLIDKKWEERKMKLHVQKVHQVGPKLNTQPPKVYPHMVLRLKKIQMEEQKQAEIDKDNQILLQRMTWILKRKGQVDNWNDYRQMSMNQLIREREQMDIAEKNVSIARKLESVKPYYSANDMEQQFEKRSYLQGLWKQSAKDFSISTPRGTMPKKTTSYEESHCDSDFGHDEDEVGDGGDRKHVSVHSYLPFIDKKEGGQGGKDDAASSSVTKLPKINNNGTTKDAITDQDAKKLFRAVKGLAKADDIVVKTLIKRSHSQRLRTKKKFEDAYDLDLARELKQSMGQSYDVVIESLLDQDGRDDISQINEAIKSGDVVSLVEFLQSRSSSALAACGVGYKKEYGVSLEEDIRERIVEEDCRVLLLALLHDRPDSDAVDEDLANTDAKQLLDAGEGRFSSNNGKFICLLTERNPSQLQTTLGAYRQVSGGSGVTAAATEDNCSAEYVRALEALEMSLEKDSAYWAEKVHSLLKPNNSELVVTLLDRSDAQMASIRRSYRRKYGAELVDDVTAKCGREAGPLIAQIAARGGAGAGAGGGAGTHRAAKPPRQAVQAKPEDPSKPRRVNGMVIRGPRKKQPLKSFEPKKPEFSTGNPFMEPQKRPIGERIKGEAQDKLDKKVVTKGGKDKQPITTGGPAGTKRKPVKGTTKAASNFNPDEDARRLAEAMKGFGTDDDPLIEILTGRTNDQRQQIRTRYQEMYKKDLLEELKSELSGDLEETMVALVMAPPEYDAYCLHGAMSGLGTQEDTLIGILTTRSPKELKAISAQYEQMYEKDLEKAVLAETSGAFADLLGNILKADRDEATKVDRARVDEDVSALHTESTNGNLLKDDIFIDVMTKRSRSHIQAVSAEYKKLSGQTLKERIQKGLAGDTQEGYIALADAIQEPSEFFARRLHGAMSGVGTDDKMLIRIVVSRSEVDLAEIKSIYKRLYNKSLEESISTECSGDYKKLLLAIVKEKEDPTEPQKKQPRASYRQRDPSPVSQRSTPRTTPKKTPAAGPTQRPQQKRSKSKSPKRNDSKTEPALKAESRKPVPPETKNKPESKSRRMQKVKNSRQKVKPDEKYEEVVDSKTAETEEPGIGKENERARPGSNNDQADTRLTRPYTPTRGTIQENPDASPEQDVETIVTAIKGWNTDETALISLLSKRTSQQRRSICQTYNRLFGKDLRAELESELRGDFEQVVVALMAEPVDQDAAVMRDTLEDLKEGNPLLNNILCHRSREELDAAITKYKESYKTEFEDDLKGEGSDFYNFVSEMIKKNRDLTDRVNEDKARQDADKLFNNGSTSLTLTEDIFVEVLATSNRAQFRSFCTEFKKLSGEELVDGIKAAKLGDSEAAIIGLVECLGEPVSYFTRQLHETMRGLGTDEKMLANIIVSRSEVDLEDIKTRYEELYGKSLEADVESECSGDFKRIILAIITGHVPKPAPLEEVADLKMTDDIALLLLGGCMGTGLAAAPAGVVTGDGVDNNGPRDRARSQQSLVTRTVHGGEESAMILTERSTISESGDLGESRPAPDVTTADVTTADVTTADVTTADVTTADVTTADVTTADVTTGERTDEESTERNSHEKENDDAELSHVGSEQPGAQNMEAEEVQTEKKEPVIEGQEDQPKRAGNSSWAEGQEDPASEGQEDQPKRAGNSSRAEGQEDPASEGQEDQPKRAGNSSRAEGREDPASEGQEDQPKRAGNSSRAEGQEDPASEGQEDQPKRAGNSSRAEGREDPASEGREDQPKRAGNSSRAEGQEDPASEGREDQPKRAGNSSRAEGQEDPDSEGREDQPKRAGNDAQPEGQETPDSEEQRNPPETSTGHDTNIEGQEGPGSERQDQPKTMTGNGVKPEGQETLDSEGQGNPPETSTGHDTNIEGQEGPGSERQEDQLKTMTGNGDENSDAMNTSVENHKVQQDQLEKVSDGEVESEGPNKAVNPREPLPPKYESEVYSNQTEGETNMGEAQLGTPKKVLDDSKILLDEPNTSMNKSEIRSVLPQPSMETNDVQLDEPETTIDKGSVHLDKPNTLSDATDSHLDQAAKDLNNEKVRAANDHTEQSDLPLGGKQGHGEGLEALQNEEGSRDITRGFPRMLANNVIEHQAEVHADGVDDDGQPVVVGADVTEPKNDDITAAEKSKAIRTETGKRTPGTSREKEIANSEADIHYLSINQEENGRASMKSIGTRTNGSKSADYGTAELSTMDGVGEIQSNNTNKQEAVMNEVPNKINDEVPTKTIMGLAQVGKKGTFVIEDEVRGSPVDDIATDTSHQNNNQTNVLENKPNGDTVPQETGYLDDTEPKKAEENLKDLQTDNCRGTPDGAATESAEEPGEPVKRRHVNKTETLQETDKEKSHGGVQDTESTDRVSMVSSPVASFHKENYPFNQGQHNETRDTASWSNEGPKVRPRPTETRSRSTDRISAIQNDSPCESELADTKIPPYDRHTVGQDTEDTCAYDEWDDETIDQGSGDCSTDENASIRNDVIPHSVGDDVIPDSRATVGQAEPTTEATNTPLATSKLPDPNALNVEQTSQGADSGIGLSAGDMHALTSDSVYNIKHVNHDSSQDLLDQSLIRSLVSSIIKASTSELETELK